MLIELEGFSTRLGDDLSSSEEYIIFEDSSYIDAHMKRGDTSYLVVGDGVKAVTLKVERAVNGYKVEFPNGIGDFPCGSCIKYENNSFVIREIIREELRDAVGEVIRAAISTDEDALGVEVENGVLTLTPTSESLCEVNVETSYDTVIACLDGEIVRVPLSTGGSGGLPGINQGSGVTISNENIPTISLESIFDSPQNACGIVFDEHGRFLEVDECPTGAGTSLFAGDISLNSGTAVYEFVVVNGQVVDMVPVGDGEDPVTLRGLGAVLVTGGPDYSLDLEELHGGEETNPYGTTYDKHGRVVSYDEPDFIPQAYTKVRWEAGVNFKGAAFGDQSVDTNINVASASLGSHPNGYQITVTFVDPAPSTNYVVMLTGSMDDWDAVERSEQSVTVIVTPTDDSYWGVYCVGEYIDPTAAKTTVFPYTPQ